MRVGVLGNEDSWYVRQISAAARRHGHEAFELQFPALRADITAEAVEVFAEELPLSSLDVLIVRTMPPGSLEQVVSRMDLLAAVEANGVRLVNPARAIEIAVDKALTLQKLVRCGVAVPHTVACETADTAMEAFTRLGGDVVVKPLFGAEGRGIMRVSHPELALRTFRTLERLNATLYLQEFVGDSQGDIRILLLDGAVVGSVRREPAAGDFRSNAAQQGSGRLWNPSADEINIARQAATATGCIFAGVDLMYTASGELVAIEVNAVPGWKSLEQLTAVSVLDRFFEWMASAH